MTITNEYCEYEVARIIDGTTYAYLIEFVMDDAGVWRLAGM